MSADSGLPNDLEVWTEAHPDEQATFVMAQLLDGQGNPLGDPFRVNGDDLRFRKLPTATRDANGNFLVAWEEETDDASDDVMTAQISSLGIILTESKIVNSTTEGQQAEPSVTADGCGHSILSWTSYDLYGAKGDIYAAVIDATGSRLGDEIAVTIAEGNQYDSIVKAASNCSAVVAWTSDPLVEEMATLAGVEDKKEDQGVFFRVLRSDGRSHGNTKRCRPQIPGRHKLVGLEVKPNGRFKVQWQTTGANGASLGLFEQDFDEEGNESGKAKRMEEEGH
jgi:hypothetical protein